MKKIFIILSLLLIFNNLLSQKIEESDKYFYSGDFSSVIRISEKLIKENPENPEIYYKCGMAYQITNRYDKAKYCLQKAFLLDSLNTTFINAYANILELLHKKQKAIFYYRKSLQIDSLNFIALNNLAKLFLANNDYNNAFKYYKTLAASDSLNSWYYRKCGLCKIKLKQTDSALMYYKKAYAVDSTNNINIKSLALVYKKNKQFEKASEICDKGIKNDSLFSGFYKIKADIYFINNHFFRAVPAYKKALQLGDSSYNVKKRLGMSLCEIKKYREALPYNISVYNIDSSSYSNTLYLCKNYLGLKNYKKSLKYAEKTLKLLRFAKTISYEVYDKMADTYMGQKEYTEAINMHLKRINTFEEASEQFKLNDYIEIAKIYDKMNDKKNALKYYKIAVKTYKKQRFFDSSNYWFIYANDRIKRLKEDLFFEGK